MNFIKLSAVFLVFLLGRCHPEYVNSERTVVKGTVTKADGTPAAGLPVSLENWDILISESRTDAQGNFYMGGPRTTDSTSLYLDKKIRKVTAISGTRFRISRDSTFIEFPSEQAFNDFKITLK